MDRKDKSTIEHEARQALDHLLTPYLANPRYAKAREALAWGDVYRSESGEIFARSSRHLGLSYRVEANRCECPARKGVCWHRVARRMLIRYEEILADFSDGTLPSQPEQTPPIKPLPGVTRWRWKAGKLPPKAKTIKQDQSELGRHLRHLTHEIPLGTTIH